jgi:hypothetical protein
MRAEWRSALGSQGAGHGWSATIASVRVIIDNGPSWMQYVTTVATAAAAAFAGFAAWVALKAARVSQDLVKLEAAREVANAEEAKWRQARSIMVDLRGRDVVGADQRTWAFDAHLLVTNASRDPIFKCGSRSSLERVLGVRS